MAVRFSILSIPLKNRSPGRFFLHISKKAVPLHRDCTFLTLYIFRRLYERSGRNRHFARELNFIENARGCRRIVGDSDELTDDIDLVLISSPQLEHQWAPSSLSSGEGRGEVSPYAGRHRYSWVQPRRPLFPPCRLDTMTKICRSNRATVAKISSRIFKIIKKIKPQVIFFPFFLAHSKKL